MEEVKGIKVYTVNEFEKETGVKFTKQHTGKMAGFSSLSTASSCNGQCKKNAKIKGSICEKCYSNKMQKRYKALKKVLEKNHSILTKEVLPVEVLPFINVTYFRFEAFGDLENETQFINYLNIANANKHCRFAIWTKNPHIIDEVLNGMNYKKPKNLNIIVSSLFINKEWNYKNSPYAQRYWFIDKVFTVYDKQYIKENNININCGAKSCISCLKCYKKNNIKIINEVLK